MDISPKIFVATNIICIKTNFFKGIIMKKSRNLCERQKTLAIPYELGEFSITISGTVDASSETCCHRCRAAAITAFAPIPPTFHCDRSHKIKRKNALESLDSKAFFTGAGGFEPATHGFGADMVKFYW